MMMGWKNKADTSTKTSYTLQEISSIARMLTMYLTSARASLILLKLKSTNLLVKLLPSCSILSLPTHMNPGLFEEAELLQFPMFQLVGDVLQGEEEAALAHVPRNFRLIMPSIFSKFHRYEVNLEKF
jgi:hypothetical protein